MLPETTKNKSSCSDQFVAELASLCGVWAEGVVLNKLNHGIWEVICSNDDEQKGPRCYHLLHYSINNIRQPTAPVPQILSWRGALHDQSLVSATDIVCNISTYAATDSSNALLWGNIQFGLAGP